MKRWKKIGIFLLVCGVGASAVWADNRLNRAPAYDAAAFAAYRGASYAPAAASRTFDGQDAFEIVGENGGAQLLFNSGTHAFSLQVKDGHRWDTFVSGDAMPEDSREETPPQALFSAVIADTRTGNTITVDPVKDSCTVEADGVEGGVQLAFSFPQYQFGLNLQVFLDGSGLICRLPLEGVTEGAAYHLVNVDVLPFFGAAGGQDEGYILFPDGAGVLCRFGDGRVGGTTPLTLDVYSSRTLDLDALEDNRAKKIQNVMLPVYGMKRGESAFVAVICEGDASASVTLAPQGYVYPLNRVYACSIYRRVTATPSESGFDVFHVEEESRGGDFAVKFFFGEGEEADYSWMARAVRGHLLESGLLREKGSGGSGAYLELLMGAGKSSMLGTNYVTMTTAAQAGMMLEELPDRNVTASLLGWQKEGYGVTPGGTSPAGSIGGKKGIAALAPGGATVALEMPVVFGSTEKTGAKRRRDAVVNVRDVTVVNASESLFVLNANTQYRLLEKRLRGLTAYADKALLLSGVAELLYEDYNEDSRMTRQESLQALQAMMDLAGKERTLLLRQANAYALPYADFLTGMPEGASGYTQLDEAVPFYYLVVNGSIPYALDTAGNLSPDLTASKLKWVEYGAVPYFLLSWESSEKLMETTADHLFSTRYADQKEAVAATLEEFAELRRQLEGQRFCGHRQVAEKVAVSSYSGGSRVIVNYSEEAVTVDGVRVEARDYRLVP